MGYRTFFGLIFITVVLILSGCVPNPVIRVEKMIPAVDHLKVPVSTKTLKLAGVKGGTELPKICCTYQEFKTDNTSFDQALLITLRNSGLFKDVIAAGTGDYELVTEIAEQENDIVGVFTYSTHLLVNYYFIDTATNKELWDAHIFSENMEKWTYAEAAQSLTFPRLNEGVVKKNLSQFVEKLHLFLDTMQNNEESKSW